MFRIFYYISLKFYYLLILISSIFNKKAKLWIKGRKKIFKKIKETGNSDVESIWFHASSLGEFEQARPLIEKIKNKYPEYKIILTFFSPSGFEIRKSYKFADYIYYLPLDSPRNAKKFISILQPKISFFVKYDFWYYYLKNLYKKNIPTYLISGIFREKQIFFRKIGKGYSKVLGFFTHIFVQNKKSAEMLESIGIKNYTIAGDTRFDRVIEIATNSAENSIVKNFVAEKFCIIAGSTWYEDEQLLAKYINESENIKFIIAPHEINENHIINLLQIINKPAIRYSRAKDKNLKDYTVMLIDNIGMLAGLYKYGKIAYIGGGFGAGIHNIVEAAVYAMPVIFGPKYKKFQEALDMIKEKTAYSINNYEELKHYFSMFVNNPDFLKTISDKAKNYVWQNKGASDKIMNYVFA